VVEYGCGRQMMGVVINLKAAEEEEEM